MINSVRWVKSRKVANIFLALSAIAILFDKYGIAKTEGNSMQPALNPQSSTTNDIVLTIRRFDPKKDIVRGSVVIFDYKPANINYEEDDNILNNIMPKEIREECI